MNGQIVGGHRGNPPRIIGWCVAASLLLLPLFAMQFTPEVNWTSSDFIVWGIMLVTFGCLFELAVRLSRLPSYRAALGLALLGAFLVTWADLAVGIVGSEDNPRNALFFAALGVGVVGAAVARLKAPGMANAMFATAAAIGLSFVLAEMGPQDELWVPVSRGALGTGLFALLFVASALLFRKAAAQSSSSS